MALTSELDDLLEQSKNQQEAAIGVEDCAILNSAIRYLELPELIIS